MRQEKFKMERPGLLEIGDKVQISEFQLYHRTGSCNVRLLQKCRPH